MLIKPRAYATTIWADKLLSLLQCSGSWLAGSLISDRVRDAGVLCVLCLLYALYICYVLVLYFLSIQIDVALLLYFYVSIIER